MLRWCKSYCDWFKQEHGVVFCGDFVTEIVNFQQISVCVNVLQIVQHPCECSCIQPYQPHLAGQLFWRQDHTLLVNWQAPARPYTLIRKCFQQFFSLRLLIHVLTSYHYNVHSVTLNKLRNMLASCSSNMVKIWSVNSTGKFGCLSTLTGHSKDNPECTYIHDPEKCLLKGNSDK